MVQFHCEAIRGAHAAAMAILPSAKVNMTKETLSSRACQSSRHTGDSDGHTGRVVESRYGYFEPDTQYLADTGP